MSKPLMYYVKTTNVLCYHYVNVYHNIVMIILCYLSWIIEFFTGVVV
jgi:hypothetical protein